MFLNHAVAFLREKTNRVFVSRTLKIIGLGETAVESQLRDLIDAQTNPTIAPYAKVGEVHIRVTASAADETAAHGLIAPVADEIYTRLAPRIYGENESSLAEIVIAFLKKQNHTLAVAESCTGGLVVSDLVSASGCSGVLREGLITYSNESKIARLSVPANTIARHGAVSAETAAAMAKNAAITSGASVGLSTTGIAGPEGGTDKKPVGLVYVGLYIHGRGEPPLTEKYIFTGTRNVVRTRAAMCALDFLRRILQN
jgi:nicotinamide-nucleotide amidase